VFVLVGTHDSATPVRLGIECRRAVRAREVVVAARRRPLPWLDDPVWFVSTLSVF